MKKKLKLIFQVLTSLQEQLERIEVNQEMILNRLRTMNQNPVIIKQPNTTPEPFWKKGPTC